MFWGSPPTDVDHVDGPSLEICRPDVRPKMGTQTLDLEDIPLFRLRGKHTWKIPGRPGGSVRQLQSRLSHGNPILRNDTSPDTEAREPIFER